jgi:oligoribonuclease
MSDNLVWMDLEFSGLDLEGGAVILELATLITNSDLQIVAEGPVLAIHQSDEILNSMDEWNTEHHTASGLVDRVKQSEYTHESTDALTAEFILKHCKKGSSPLCGNSIHQDRRFLYRYMPQISDALHYRNIDVSTFKELSKRWTPEVKPYPKKKAHLALDDIIESIEELKHFRQAWNL